MMGWRGFYAFLRREVKKFLEAWKITLVPSIVTQALYITVFGGILSTHIRNMQGFSYIDFILPGVILLGASLTSFNNSTFTVFYGRRNKHINEVLTSPLSYTEIMLGYITASLLRGFLVGTGITAVALLFTSLKILNPLIFGLFFLLSVVLFSSFGAMVGLWAEEFEDTTVFTNFLLTPLIFLGGVFYSIKSLPTFWQNVSYLNPLVYMVNGLRYGMLGYTDINISTALALLVSFTAVFLSATWILFQNGYGLQE
ncbi:MAG: ABC transporter permease [Candidatus Nanohaloarchaea archaeon]|nr:ABC transporter permease [Candidatus Nanohaloarchaea archaeon]